MSQVASDFSASKVVSRNPAVPGSAPKIGDAEVAPTFSDLFEAETAKVVQVTNGMPLPDAIASADKGEVPADAVKASAGNGKTPDPAAFFPTPGIEALLVGGNVLVGNGSLNEGVAVSTAASASETPSVAAARVPDGVDPIADAQPSDSDTAPEDSNSLPTAAMAAAVLPPPILSIVSAPAPAPVELGVDDGGGSAPPPVVAPEPAAPAPDFSVEHQNAGQSIAAPADLAEHAAAAEVAALKAGETKRDPVVKEPVADTIKPRHIDLNTTATKPSAATPAAETSSDTVQPDVEEASTGTDTAPNTTPAAASHDGAGPLHHRTFSSHGSGDPEPRPDVQAGPLRDDFGQAVPVAAQAGHGAINGTVAVAAPDLSPAAPSSSADAPVPLTGVALAITTQALAGRNRFEIRLDPPELGRIDVRLDIDSGGSVTSRLVAERVETLDLLRRDANDIERALQQAGLKTPDNSLQFSLRDQGFAGRNPNPSPTPSTTHVFVPDGEPAPVDALPATYGRMWRAGSGIDIRV